MKEAFKERLERLRDEHSNEIPNNWIDSRSPNNSFKVRGNWFFALVAVLENGILDGEIRDPIVIRKISRGINRFTRREFTKENPTQAREIKYANLMIDLALKGK